MAVDVGSGINAAKRSFFSVALPMIVGAFIVALIMGMLGQKAE
ncbi:MAG: hypothetical protein WC277_07550 [Bacilli bacterium]